MLTIFDSILVVHCGSLKGHVSLQDTTNSVDRSLVNDDMFEMPEKTFKFQCVISIADYVIIYAWGLSHAMSIYAHMNTFTTQKSWACGKAWYA